MFAIGYCGCSVDDDDDDKERLAGQLTYGISRDSDDCSVCYILKDDKKEKSIPVTNSLTLILKSLHGNHSSGCCVIIADLQKQRSHSVEQHRVEL